MGSWVRWFDSIAMSDVPSVGGKNASLGEMRRALTPLGIRTPEAGGARVRSAILAREP